MNNIIEITRAASERCVDFPNCYKDECEGLTHGCECLRAFHADIEKWLETKVAK